MAGTASKDIFQDPKQTLFFQVLKMSSQSCLIYFVTNQVCPYGRGPKYLTEKCGGVSSWPVLVSHVLRIVTLLGLLSLAPSGIAQLC